MPTSCEPCPGKTSASTGALDLVLGLHLEHLAAAVVPAAAADPMRELRLPALRAGRGVGRSQRVVRTPRARLGLRQLLLGNRHRSLSSDPSDPISSVGSGHELLTGALPDLRRGDSRSRPRSYT